MIDYAIVGLRRRIELLEAEQARLIVLLDEHGIDPDPPDDDG